MMNVRLRALFLTLGASGAFSAPVRAQSAPSPVTISYSQTTLAAARAAIARRDPGFVSLSDTLRRSCARDATVTVAPGVVRENSDPGSYEHPNHNPIYTTLATQSGIAYDAALCYRLFDDAAAGQQALAIIDGWSGAAYVTDISKWRATTSLARLMQTANLLRGTPLWDARRERDFAATVHTRFEPMVLDPSPPEHANNIADEELYFRAVDGAFFANRLALDAVARMFDAYVVAQIDPTTGELVHETCRNETGRDPKVKYPPGYDVYCGGPTAGFNGIGYTARALEELALTAIVLEANGYPIWTQGDTARLLPRGYEYLIGVAEHPETFRYAPGLARVGLAPKHADVHGLFVFAAHDSSATSAAYVATHAKADRFALPYYDLLYQVDHPAPSVAR